jgi:hypothetical protein
VRYNQSETKFFSVTVCGKMVVQDSTLQFMYNPSSNLSLPESLLENAIGSNQTGCGVYSYALSDERTASPSQNISGLYWVDLPSMSIRFDFARLFDQNFTSTTLRLNGLSIIGQKASAKLVKLVREKPCSEYTV